MSYRLHFIHVIISAALWFSLWALSGEGSDQAKHKQTRARRSYFRTHAKLRMKCSRNPNPLPQTDRQSRGSREVWYRLGHSQWFAGAAFEALRGTQHGPRWLIDLPHRKWEHYQPPIRPRGWFTHTHQRTCAVRDAGKHTQMLARDLYELNRCLSRYCLSSLWRERCRGPERGMGGGWSGGGWRANMWLDSLLSLSLSLIFLFSPWLSSVLSLRVAEETQSNR